MHESCIGKYKHLIEKQQKSKAKTSTMSYKNIYDIA